MYETSRRSPRCFLPLIVLAVMALGERGAAQVELLYSQTYNVLGGSVVAGRRILALGDVDGDGIGDLAVSDPQQVTPLVTVRSGVDGSILRFHYPTAIATDFGQALAGPGDLDGDGVADLVIGEPGSSLVGFAHGAVHAYSGATGLLLWTALGSESDARLGHSLCAIGDVNGDGVPDLAAGIPRRDAPGALDAGGIFVLSGSDGSLLRVISGTTPGGLLGWSCAAIGDVDLDGTGDFAAGALYDDSPTLMATGAAHVYSGLTGAVLSSSYGATGLARHGYAVAGAGDVDGDGRPDYMVGAPWEDLPGGLLDVGLVEIRSGATFTLIRTITGGPTNHQVGTSLAAYGDLDDDGKDDVLIGAGAGQVFATGGTGGALRFHLGRDGSVLFALFGASLEPDFGAALAVTGDLDGDGVGDLAIATHPYAGGRLEVFRVLPTQVLGGGQANGAQASLLIDDIEPGSAVGPFVSYLKAGRLHSFVVEGSPNALFSIYGSAILNPGGWLFPGFGSLDIGTGPAFADVMMVVDGFAGLLPVYAIDLGGSARVDFTIPTNWPLGTFVNVQALVQKPQPWTGGIWSTLSAAHRLVIR